MTRQSLQSALGLKDEEHFRKAYLLPALEAGLIEMTIPEKPRSSKQKYRLTDKGRRLSSVEVKGEATPEVTQEVTPEVRISKALTGEMTRQSLQSALGLKDEEHFRKAYLLPALEAGLIEMTIPEKPRSSKQKYRLTDKGRRLSAAQSG